MKNYYITEITVPPPPSSSSSSSYNVETTNSDISILKLAETLVFTWRVSPICLTPPDLTFYKEIVTVIGWGRRFEDDNRRPTVLRDVNLKGKLTNFYLPLSNVTLTFFFWRKFVPTLSLPTRFLRRVFLIFFVLLVTVYCWLAFVLFSFFLS